MVPIRQFRVILLITKVTVRAPEGQNHRALLACLIYLRYVHDGYQSNRCKIKDIRARLWNQCAKACSKMPQLMGTAETVSVPHG